MLKRGGETYRQSLSIIFQGDRDLREGGRDVLSINSMVRYTVKDQNLIRFRPQAGFIVHNGFQFLLILFNVLPRGEETTTVHLSKVHLQGYSLSISPSH